MKTAIGYIINNKRYTPFKIEDNEIVINGMTIFYHFRQFSAHEIKDKIYTTNKNDILNYLNNNFSLTNKYQLLEIGEEIKCELRYYYNFDNDRIYLFYSHYSNPLYILDCKSDTTNSVLSKLRLIESFFKSYDYANELVTNTSGNGFIGIKINDTTLGFVLSDGHYKSTGTKILHMLKRIYRIYWVCKSKVNLFYDFFMEFMTKGELSEEWYSNFYDYKELNKLDMSKIKENLISISQYINKEFDILIDNTDVIENPSLRNFRFSYIFELENMECAVYESTPDYHDYYKSLTIDTKSNINSLLTVFEQYNLIKRDFICKLIYNNQKNNSKDYYDMKEYIDMEDTFWHLYNFYWINFSTSEI